MASPIFGGDVGAPTGSEPLAMQHGLYWLIADLAEGRPLILIVDDAQWGDLVSLRALGYLARRLEGLPVTLAVAIRTGEPDSPEALLDELRRESCAQLISPRPLTEVAAAELAGKELGTTPSARFASASHRATAGNPFLIVELLRALAADEIAPSDENASRIEPFAAAGVGRSILSRLARLGETATDVARAVAVLEPNAEPQHVGALTELDPQDTADACSRLIATHLLSDERPLGFVHPLVRSAVYSDMPEPLRAHLHSEAAKRLSAIGDPVDVVAGHLLLAPPSGDPEVVDVLRDAAREAGGRGAPESAAEFLRRARAEPPPPSERFDVELELGFAQLNAADEAGVETLLELRSRTEDTVLRARIAAVLALSLTYRGREQETVSLLEESVAELGGSDRLLDLRLRGELLELSFWGREEVPEGLASTADERPDSFEARRLMEVVSFLDAMGRGPIERAEKLARAAMGDLGTSREDSMAGFPPTRSATVLVLADHGDQLEEFFDMVSEVARRRNLNAVATGFGMHAYCRALDGDMTQAHADAEMALELMLPLGVPVLSRVWEHLLTAILVERGEFDSARQYVPLDVFGEDAPGLPGALSHCRSGELRSALGEHEAARHDFLAAGARIFWLPFANPEILGWRTGLATAEAALGNEEEAQRLAGEAVRIAREAGGARGIGVALRVQGTVTGSGEGVEILRQAADTLGGTRARLQHAKALVDLGAALRRGNQRKEARDPLREGLDLAHRCGAPPLEERAKTELAAAGARPRSAVRSGIDSLTPSELRVARMASDGMTNREIAQRLFVTSKTIETHLRHVFQKLDVGGRSELPAELTPL